jgi:hypothetical protein
VLTVSMTATFRQRFLRARTPSSLPFVSRFGFSRPGLSRPLLTGLLVACGLLGCDAFSGLETPETAGNLPPLTRPLYPTGIALHPTENMLAVVSSNFDLRHASGALLLADLDQVTSDLANGNDDGTAISLMPYVDAAFIPSFGNRPVWSTDGARLVLPVRDDNRLIEVNLDLATTKPRLTCGDRFDDETPTCDASPYAVTLAGSDPYSVVLYEETPDRISGVVGLVSSPDLYFFTIRPSLDGFDRIRMAPLSLAGDALGVRGLAVRSVGNMRTVFATVDRLGTSTRGLSSVVFFDPTRANPVSGDTSAVVVRSIDLFDLTGSSSARDLAVTPDGDGLLVLLRLPDGLLRLDITPTGSTVALELGGLGPTCREPSAIAIARLTGTRFGDVDRAIVTCFGSDAVVGHDPLHLHETDAARFFGDGPFDVVIDARPDRGPAAYVSYFLDDSIGVFSLVDENGDVRLTPKGRIGTARPPREDGR